MSSIFSTAVSGLTAQSQVLSVSAANVVNIGSLGLNPDGTASRPGAYAPQRAVLTSTAQGGVRAEIVAIDPASFQSVEPNDPDAGADGTVPRPNVSLEREFVIQMIAFRAFQANVRTIETQDRMLGELINLRT